MTNEVRIWRKDDVLELLTRRDATGKKAVVNAIKGLYARQTESEKADKTTRCSNGRGFNAKDARFLSSIAQALPRYHDNMTDRQLYVARKMLRKYWRQLLEIIEEKGGKVEYPKVSKAVQDSLIGEIADSVSDEGTEIEAPVLAQETPATQWGVF